MRPQAMGGGLPAAAAFRRVSRRLAVVVAAVAATAATCTRVAVVPTPRTTATAVPSTAPARATFYVAPSGDDANPGTEAQPFQTIQRAADVLNPGDTVLVEDGTYTGSGAGTPCASASSRPVVCAWRGGTSTAWVTFRSVNRQGAKINGRGNASNYGFQFPAGAGYIRLEGFDVFGMGNASGDAAGFVIYDGGHDVVIAHNDIHAIGKLCTDTTNGEAGIFIENARVTVEGNRIHDIGRFAPGEKGCAPAAPYYQNHDHGIYINGHSGSAAPGASEVTVTNNIFWNEPRGWAIQVYPGSVASLRILNNTFAGANPYSDGQIILAASTTDARIVNNIFLEPLSAAINFYSGTHNNLAVTNNLSSGPIATSTPGQVVFSANLDSIDPGLDAAFEPVPGSPVIDAGSPLPEVAVDIAGTSRPQGAGWDIGAYEMKLIASTFVVRLFTPPALQTAAGGRRVSLAVPVAR